MKKRFSRTFVLNTLSILAAGIAACLALGYMQSDTQTRWTRCDVDTHPRKMLMSGVKQWSSKILFCENYTVVIAIKQNQSLPMTPDSVLEKNTYVDCSYDVARNPFHLFRDQVIRESVACFAAEADNDTG